MPKPPENPIVFTRHEDIKPLPFVGYEHLIRAGVGMGMRALEGEEDDYTVLLAGYPGTGKTVYSQVLARALPGFSHLYIKCNALIDTDDVGEIRRNLVGSFSYLSQTPLVVAFDEVDSIASNRDMRPIEYTLLTASVMNMLDRRPGKTLVLAISNYPNNLDMAITSRLQYTLFFDLPDAGMLGKTLEGLRVPNPSEVAEIMCEKAAKTDGRLVVRSLVRACKKVKERLDDPEKMAELLFPHANQFDNNQIRDYELKNRGYRDRSQSMVEYWEKVAEEYIGKGLVKI